MQQPFWWPEAKTVIGLLVVGSTIAISFVLLYKPDAAANDTLKTLLGGLMTVGFATIINFYFGSSVESARKGDTIAKIAMDGKPDDTDKPLPRS